MATNLFDTLSPKAAFASKLLASAGLNLDDLQAKGDINAVKVLCEAAKPAELATAITEATASLQASVTDVTASRDKALATLTPLTASLNTLGINLTTVLDDKSVFSAEKFQEQHKLIVAKAARVELARHGITPIEDTPAGEPLKKGQTAQILTLAEFKALPNAVAKMEFCRKGGQITA